MELVAFGGLAPLPRPSVLLFRSAFFFAWGWRCSFLCLCLLVAAALPRGVAMASGGAWMPRLALVGGLPPPFVGRRFVGFPTPSLCSLLPRCFFHPLWCNCRFNCICPLILRSFTTALDGKTIFPLRHPFVQFLASFAISTFLGHVPWTQVKPGAFLCGHSTLACAYWMGSPVY
jgi:hypothetical protein